MMRDRSSSIVGSKIQATCTLVCLALTVLLVVFNAPLGAVAQPIAKTEPAGDSRNRICQLVEAAAHANALPVGFFARLIWEESRFQPDEVGPVTRNGKRAQGIAQFMPGTAAERQVLEPFNPVEALPKSGEFLAELRAEFGNLGLAAAAYNAGPQRVRDFLSGLRQLPAETRTYVRAVTGHSVEEWALPAQEGSGVGQSSEPSEDGGSVDCSDLMALLERAPSGLTAPWQGRKFPSWCRGLRHPNTEECGPVHLTGSTANATSVSSPHSRVHLARSSSR